MKAPIVILWWCSDLRIRLENGKVAARTLGPGEEPVAAILKMLGEECPGVKTVRIIYQPETLAVHEVSCPKSNRARLRKILAAEFPALNAPNAVWSAEKIQGDQTGSWTVLYIDHASALPRLLEGFGRRRINVEGVWPLQSLLEAADVTETGGRDSMSLVATSGRALVSSGGTSGDRMVRIHAGPEFADAAIAEMRTVHARLEEDGTFPGTLVVEDGPSAAALRKAARAYDLIENSMASLLWGAQFLEPGGFSDFRRLRPLMPRPKALRAIVAALGLALLAGGGWFAWTMRRDGEKRQRQLAALREQDSRLQQMAADRTAAQGKIAGLMHDLDRMQCARPSHYEFLKIVAAAMPETIALQALTIEQDGFSINGHVYEGAGRPDGPLPSFCRELAPPGALWRLSDQPRESGADFTLRGSFRAAPAAPPGAAPATAAQLESRLAAAWVRLPLTKTFDAWMQGWHQDWTVETCSTDRFPGLEVRHYALAYGLPNLDAWPRIVETVKTMCAEPGLTIDRLALALAPDAADASSQARIAFTVRLRP